MTNIKYSYDISKYMFDDLVGKCVFIVKTTQFNCGPSQTNHLIGKRSVQTYKICYLKNEYDKSV